MCRPKRATVFNVVVGLAVVACVVCAEEATQSEREAMYYRYLDFASYVKGSSVEPHWMADGSSFWYAESAPANTVIWKVDPVANAKTLLFDTERLRQALTKVLGHEPPYKGLPFEKFTFVDESEQEVKFTMEGEEFILQLDSYTVTKAPGLSEKDKRRLTPDDGEVLSPDRKWFASVKGCNLWLRSTYDGRSIQLTTDGVREDEWVARQGWCGRWAWWSPWSPDSFRLAVRKADFKRISKIPIVHYLKHIEELEWARFNRPGESLPRVELFIVDMLSKERVRVETGKATDQQLLIIGWLPDGSELLFLRLDPEFKKLDLMAANAETGAARTILTEEEDTFLHFPCYRPLGFTLLGDGKRFIWVSERDGWNHLYLYNLEGSLVRQLTTGAFPVVQIVALDEERGWVYFTGHGNQQRPYDTHLHRVSLEGKELTQLTEATGRHEIRFSPSKEFFLDTYKNVDRLPATELRRADGQLLQVLSRAFLSNPEDLKWRPPEEFVVKAADGKADLFGVLYKPYDFNPNEKYPVIEIIVGRPDVAVNEILRVHSLGAEALAQLGFVVFVADARGTPERGKAFHDVVYGNVGRNEIPDHVAVLKQLAAERPYMDLSRVGVLGSSYGGYFALRAMLLAADVYHVGVANTPLVALSGGWADLTVNHMGLPQNNREGYKYGSNLRLAGKLNGKLLLIHGTSDTSVPLSHTMKMVAALIRAGKRFDLLIVPGGGHSYSETTLPYVVEAIRRYFQERLKP